MAICSKPFATLGQTCAGSHGLPGLAIVLVEHPIGGLPKAEAQQRVVPILDELVEALTLPLAVLAPRFDGRFLTPFRPPRPNLVASGVTR